MEQEQAQGGDPLKDAITKLRSAKEPAQAADPLSDALNRMRSGKSTDKVDRTAPPFTQAPSAPMVSPSTSVVGSSPAGSGAGQPKAIQPVNPPQQVNEPPPFLKAPPAPAVSPSAIIKDKSGREFMDYTDSLSDDPLVREFVSLTKGKKYKLGAKGTGNISSLGSTTDQEVDCSGAMCAVVNKFRDKAYDPLYTSAATIASKSKPLKPEEASRGDYVFMRTGGKGVDHIGMLITDTAGRKYIAESSSSFNGPSITLLQDRIDSLKESSPNLIVEYGRDDSNISREPVSSGQRSAGGPPAGSGGGQPLTQSTGLGGPVGGTRFALPTEQEERAIDVERGVTKYAKPIGDKFTASDISDAVIGQQRSEEMYAERIKAGFGIEPRKGESARDTYREMTSYYDDQVANLDARGVEALKANTEKGIQGLRGMASELKQEMDGLEQAAREFEQQISALPPEQAKAALDAFNTNAQEQARLLDGRRKEIEDLEYALVRDLQMAALRDHDIKKETGSGWGVAALVGPKGISRMSAGLTSFVIDGMTMLMPAEILGPEVASGEKTRDQAAKEIKRMMLDDIRKGGAEVTRKALGLETTEEYYQDAAANGPFMAKAMIGLGESLPAMATPFMTGIFFQTADAIGEELEGEGFDDILEIEKVGLKAAFALPALALERLGFRNLVKNSAATKTILARAIGKIPMNATPGQIQRIIDGETRSYVTNFAARMGGAVLSEGETGGAQAFLDITTRKIYNRLKGRDILKTPETLVDAAYQIAEGSALEMAGAGALGAPVALRAAMRTGSVTRKITDRQYSLLEGLLTDENYAGTIASYHDELVKSGKMTSEQKVKIEEDLRVAQEIASQIPEDLPTEKRREAFDLLLEKQRLSGKDKNLVKGRIIDIDDELMNLAGAKPAAKEGDVKTEAPTPPQAPVPVSPEVRDEILRARQELGVDFDPLEDLPESVVITFGRVEDNIPVSAVDIEAASSWMYKKYKDVMSMRNDPNRLLTLDQIDSYAAQLGADIELLENHKQKLRDESEGVGAAQAANTKGATAPVSGTQTTETKPQGRVAPTATQAAPQAISPEGQVVPPLMTLSEGPSIGIGGGQGFAPRLRELGYTDAEISKMTFEQQQNIVEKGTEPARAESTARVTPTAKGPVSPVDGEMTVKSFAESIASGNRLDTPEAVQFYENNKKEIEAELQRMAGPQKQAPQQAPVDPNDDAEVTLDEEVADDPDALLEEAMGTPLTDEEIDAEIADIAKSVSGTDTEVIDLDQDGYAKAAKDASGDTSNSMSEGFFIGKDSDGKRRIYINRDMFRRGLMAHEGTHAIIFAALSKDPKAKKIISNSAKQALGASPGAKKVLLKFLENYGGAKTKADGSVDVDATVADPELGEEVMSEFVAALYNGSIKLDNATRQFIRDLYNRIMAALGVSTKVEFKEDGDFIAAAKQIASAMRAGRKIKTGMPAGAIAGQSFNKKDIKYSLQGVLSGKEKVPKFSALDDIASWIAEHAKKNPVVKPGIDLMTSEGRAEAVRSIVKHTMLELDAWSSVKKDYKSFYGDDIQKHTNPLISQYVEMKYGRKPTKDEISLIHLLSAFGSGQSTPTVDTQHGLSVFDEYMKTGKVTGYTDNPVQRYKAFEPGKPPQPVFIDSETGEMTPVKKGNKPMMREDRGGQVSKTYNVSGLRRFMEIYNAFGGDLHKTMSWLGSKHSFAEIERVIGPEAAKNLSPHEYLNKNSQTFGVFSLGDNPKLGSYILNRWSHFGTITKDMWVARTMSRYFNEPNTGVPWKLTKVDLNKRKILDEAWGMVAKKRGVEPANVQEMMWDAEKSIYARLGQATDASYTSTGVAEAMSKLQREADKPKFSKKTPAEVRAGAEKVRAMTKEDRDNYDPSEDGNYYGYNLYDAERLVPKPTEKPKRVTDSNSFNLSSEWHSVINVDGTVYGLTKYEDPDAADDSEDSAGFPKEYVWAYARMDDPSSVKETTTRDVAELVNDIKGSVGPKFSKKTPATQGDFKKGKIKDLLDKKDWVIMTAENPSAKKMSDAQNALRMKLLMADLDAMGAEYTPVDGKYGNEEKSLAITGVTEKQAIKLGKKYGQESVLTNKGLVYQDGSYNPATGASELDTKPDDFYSVVNGQVFQIDIDFGEKVQPPKFSMGERRLKDKVEQTSGDVKFFQSGGDYFFSTADGFFKGIPEAGGKRISRQDYDSALSKERIKQLERGEVVRDMGNRSDSVVASDSDKTARSWMDKMVASDNAVMMKSTETASIQTLQGVAKEFGLSVDPNKAIKPALMGAVRREINRRKVSGEADKPKFSKATPGKNRVPQEHRDNLTDDGKGNYVFFHKGPKSLKGGKINPSYFGSGKSKDNRSNPVMNYYTKPDQGERMISGDVTYAVPVPKWKVYPLMSDPLDLYDKAEANFRKKFGKDQAFDAVRQADFIGPLAEKAGFDMMIAGWSVHPLRAESGKALKPDAKLTKKYEDEGVVDLTAPGAYERMMAKARGDVKFSKKTDQAFDGKKVPKTPIGDTKTVMVDGKERTVFNSNGKPIHPTVEGVENFWKWFGESKVVDEKGRPRVVYHGGGSDFDAFDISRSRQNMYGTGVYTSTDPVVADAYAVMARERGASNTMALYMKADRPMYVSSNDPEYDDLFLNEKSSSFLGYGDGVRASLAALGHDSLVVKNTGLGQIFVAMSPEQVKSATGNYGTFDPSDPDIRFSSASPENIAKALIAKGYNTKAKAREYMVSKGADRMVDQVMAEFDKLRDAANARKAAPPKQAPQKPVGDGVKKTFAGQRVYEGSFRDEVREEVRKLGLFRAVESRAEAREKAKKLIESVGIDAAVDAVRNKDMEGGAAAFVWDEALRQLDNEILESTDPTTHQELVSKQAEMVLEIDDMQVAAGRFSSAWGDILKNSDLGYHSKEKAKEWEYKFGERPSKEIMDGWRKRDEELAELKKKLDAAEKRAEEAQAKAAIDAIAEAVTRDNERTKSGRYSGRAKRMADEFRKLKTKPMVILDADGKPMNITKLGSALPFDWNELIEVGAKAIEKTGQVADAVTAMAEKLNKQKWFSSLDDRNKMAVMSQLEDAVKGSSEGFGNERIKVPVAMIRNAVAAGIRDIDMLVNVIKEQIKDQYPDASDREIRDAITGYGKVVNMSKDEISVAIRRMKDIGRVASALEDIEKKIRPMRSGLQRDKLDAEQRALHNKLRDAMRDLPVDQAENDRVLKTALEAAKTRARNRIEDLQREIDTKERAERKQSGIIPDSELAALIKERDMLKEEHDRVFGPRVVTEEMRVKSALDSIRRSIEEYERRIAANELDPKKQTPALDTPELKIARENLGKLRDDYKKLQDEAGVVDRRRTEAAKKATKSRIAELERRIADQDFSKKPVRKTIADDELTTLRAEKERIKEQYDSDFYKEMMRNRTAGQRVGDAAWEAWGVLRAVQSTLDLSFVLLQGGVMTISNMWRRPDVVASAFKNMFASMGSEKKSEEWLRKIKAQPWYDQAKEAKLAITQPHAQLTNREELFMSDWTRIAWSIMGLPLMLKSKAAHDRWVKLNPFRALERGASAYLDTLRVERYLEGVKMLEARKADINGKEVTTQDYKDVADVVNTLTGRASLGALEGFSKGLTRMFYSPRMWASAIKTGTPYGLYHFGKMTPTARKMALMDMGRFFGTTMGVVTLSAIALAGDDDDETYVETDPRSSDFGKIRIGDIRIDPWGGRVQQAVAMTRMTIGGISLFMDKPIDAYKRGDKTMPLGKGFGTPTMFDVGLTMATNKLSPSASFLVEAARTTIGKDDKRYTMYDKDPYVIKDEFNERLMPLYVGTVAELMQDDPGALEGFLSFYSLFGASVSVYGKKPKAKASGTTQGPARVPKRPE